MMERREEAVHPEEVPLDVHSVFGGEKMDRGGDE